MAESCRKCPTRCEMVGELLILQTDGDPIRGMELLTDLVLAGEEKGIIKETDRTVISMMQHLLGACVRQQKNDIFQKLKVPA